MKLIATVLMLVMFMASSAYAADKQLKDFTALTTPVGADLLFAADVSTSSNERKMTISQIFGDSVTALLSPKFANQTITDYTYYTSDDTVHWVAFAAANNTSNIALKLPTALPASGTEAWMIDSLGNTSTADVVFGDNTVYSQDAAPGTCATGDLWVDTNGTSGQRLYSCESTDTWVAQAGGGGGISHATSDGSYYASRNGAWTAIDSVFVTPTGSGSSLTVTATGFDGNLDTGDNTLQEIAQAFDDFTASGTGDMILANAQTVTGKKTFENSDLAMLGSSTGATTFASANAGASNYTATFQAATGTVAYTADVPTAGSLSVDDLITLSGVATGAVNLGSFTGATIDDNLTVKAAMQDMETSFEAKLPAGADGEYGAWLTNNTVNPNTYSTGKTGFAYYNSIAYFCINGTCSAIGTNPMTASGDMVKGGTSGVPTRMIPATGIVAFLETSSSANLATALTDENTASGGICTNPMTTAGDLITGGASGAHTARIAAVATGSVLVSQGTSTAPAYSANPQVTTIELGAASDTTLARSGAGAMTLEGVAVPTISSSSTLTNKTLDVEGTGNAITTVEKIWFAAAGCNNATAATFFDLPTTNAPASACITGTNTQKAVLDYDAATDESGQVTLALPADFTGAIDVKYKWLAAATSGSVVWGVQTICVADAETDDPSFNTASTVTDAVKGTTLQTNDASITGVTATGCAAGELMHLRFFRDADNGADDMTGDARLIGAEVTLRRAQ